MKLFKPNETIKEYVQKIRMHRFIKGLSKTNLLVKW